MRALFLLFFTSIAAFAQNEKMVIIVNGSIVDGVENRIYKYPWQEDLDRAKLFLYCDSLMDGFHQVLYFISNNSVTIYREHVFLHNELFQGKVSPGDVVIIDPVDAERAEKLDRIKEVHQALGNVKWNEYKHWLYVKVTSPQSSVKPLQSPSPKSSD